VPHTSFLRARVPVRDVQQVTNVFCLQECSVAWATFITNGMDNDCWRVHTHESLFIAWRSDSLERIDNEWQMLFPRDASFYKNWRGFMRVRMGFLGWSTAASPVRLLRNLD
jgi:hypothetical protein